MTGRSTERDLLAAALPWLKDTARAEGLDVRHARTELTISASALCGRTVRADIALVCDQALIVAELKSGSDNLDRLDRQARAYGRAGDYCWLIADQRWQQASGIDTVVPDYWGLAWASGPPDQQTITASREARRSTDLCPVAIAQFLWAAEARTVANALREQPVPTRASRLYTQQVVADALKDHIDVLSAVARLFLRGAPSLKGGRPHRDIDPALLDQVLAPAQPTRTTTTTDRHPSPPRADVQQPALWEAS